MFTSCGFSLAVFHIGCGVFRDIKDGWKYFNEESSDLILNSFSQKSVILALNNFEKVSLVGGALRRKGKGILYAQIPYVVEPGS